jgi:CubicO group peptidase (beta-lactamase class C family)
MLRQSTNLPAILFTLILIAGCGRPAPVATSTPTLPIATSTRTLPSNLSIRPTDSMLMIQISSGVLSGTDAPMAGFWFDQADVSNGQYIACVEKGGCEIPRTCVFFDADWEIHADRGQAITCASWSEAKTYCEWAGGRLPNESEQAYAVQQGVGKLAPWGDTRNGFRCLVQSEQASRPWPTYGWTTDSPGDQGMDPEKIAAGIQRMEATFPYPHSLLIIRHGYIVVERYYNGFLPTTSQDIASVNKSFLSALIGIAIEQGAIPGIDQKMMDYFPEYATPAMDPRAYDITIGDLLTMTSGFYWPENEPVAPAYIEQAFASGAPQDTLLRAAVVNTPGTTFNYCTACTHVLSIILQDSTGMPAQDFAQKYLMDPLGISPQDWDWDQTPSGYNTGGWSFYLTPRDMAKLGYLYLNNGNWNGQEVVPEAWVRASRQSQVDFYSSTFSTPHEGYGYLWWTTMVGSHPAFYAVGHGGQYIYILPILDMIIVITQKTESHRPGDPFEIIRDYFAPAVQN